MIGKYGLILTSLFLFYRKDINTYKPILRAIRVKYYTEIRRISIVFQKKEFRKVGRLCQ